MLKRFYLRVVAFIKSEQFAFILIGLGVLVRLKGYFENCSLCPDESYVAIETVHRSLKEIFTFNRIFPLAASHPAFFILAVKSAVLFFGNCEYALRLVPLLAGVVSIILFYRLLKTVMPSGFRILALALFVFCDPLVYFSSELKPYTTDVLVALGLYLFLEHSRKKSFGVQLAAQWGIVGAAAMWLSSSSIFIFGGVGLVVLTSLTVRRQWKNIRFLSETFLLWAVSFAPLYFLSFKPMTNSRELIGMWENYNPFMSQPFLSIENIFWVKSVFLRMFYHPAGVPFTYLALALFLGGCFSFYRKDRLRLGIFIAPLLLALVAAMLKKYPFHGRMLLFLTPGVYILMVEGVAVCAQLLKAYRHWVVVVLVGVLLFYPIQKTVFFLRHQRCQDYGRRIMQYLAENYRPGGLVYLPDDSAYVFAYYSSQTKLSEAMRVSFFVDWDEQPLRAIKYGSFSQDLFGDPSRPFFYFCYQFCCYNEFGFFREILVQDQVSVERAIYQKTPDDFLERQDAWVYIYKTSPEAKKFVLGYFDAQARRIKQFEIGDEGLYLFSFSGSRKNE